MHVMVSRWNFGLSLAEGRFANAKWAPLAEQAAAGVAATPDALVDYWAGRLVQRRLLGTDRGRLIDYVGAGSSAPLGADALAARVPVLASLLLDSPYGQWR
jgi:hypothetical protein